MQLPTLSLAVPAGKSLVAFIHFSKLLSWTINLTFISRADEEYKLSKSRLPEVIERSIPSHIYILVSYIILPCTYYTLKCKKDVIILYSFTANIANYRGINEIKKRMFEGKGILFFFVLSKCIIH